MRCLPIRDDISRKRRLLFQYRHHPRASPGASPVDVIIGSSDGRIACLDGVGEGPQLKIVGRKVVNVGAYGFNDGSVVARRRRPMGISCPFSMQCLEQAWTPTDWRPEINSFMAMPTRCRSGLKLSQLRPVVTHGPCGRSGNRHPGQPGFLLLGSPAALWRDKLCLRDLLQINVSPLCLLLLAYGDSALVHERPVPGRQRGDSRRETLTPSDRG
jgi:hypothetical protein